MQGSQEPAGCRGKRPDLSGGRGTAGSRLESLLSARQEEGQEGEFGENRRPGGVWTDCCLLSGYGVVSSPQRTENMGRENQGQRRRQGDTQCRRGWSPWTGRQRGRRDKWAVFLGAETRSGSIVLWLVNCYHFGRIFTSFGSCLSEIHNMCSLH